MHRIEPCSVYLHHSSEADKKNQAKMFSQLGSRLVQMLGNKKKLKTVAEISLEYTNKFEVKNKRKQHKHETKKRINIHLKRNYPATYVKKTISGVVHWGLKKNRNLRHYDTEEEEDEDNEEEEDENEEEDEEEEEALSVEENVEVVWHKGCFLGGKCLSAV